MIHRTTNRTLNDNKQGDNTMTASNKVAMVTGAGSGVGRACALGLMKAGFAVVLAGRRADKLQETADAGKAFGTSLVVPADMTDPDSIAALFAKTTETFGRLDVLFNNAGIGAPPVAFEDVTVAQWKAVVDTNLTAPFLLAGHAARRMSTRHGGSGGVIVNVSSIAARLGSGGQYVDYAASKAGLDALTKGLADEVAAEGVRVVSVRPGLVDTAIHGKGGEPDRAIRLADRIPMRRAGTAREIARTILWLLSGDASYITGTTIDVSGGR